MHEVGDVLFFCCKIFRYLIHGEKRPRLRNFKITALRNTAGIGQHFGITGEQLFHLFRRFEIELIGFKLHAVGVGAVLFCADTEKDILRNRILLLRIVSVVRYHHRHAYLACHLNQHRRNLLLVGDTMLLQLDKVIVDAEYAAVTADMRFGLGLFALQQQRR